MRLSEKKLTVLFLIDSDFNADSRAQKMVKALSEDGHRLTVIHAGTKDGIYSNDENQVKFISLNPMSSSTTKSVAEPSTLLNILILSFAMVFIIMNLFRRKNKNVTMATVFVATATLLRASFKDILVSVKRKIRLWLRPKKPGTSLMPYLLKCFLLKKKVLKQVSKTAHEYDLVHANEFITLPIAYSLKKKFNIPFLYDSHEYEIGKQYIHKFSSKIIHLLEKRYIYDAAQVITVSDKIAEKLSDHYAIQQPLVIYNSPLVSSSQLPEQTIRTLAKIPEDHKIIVFVGGLVPRRGLYQIIESLKYLDGYSFVHVARRQEVIDVVIRNHAAINGVQDRIHLLNSVEHDQVVNFIRTADVGLLVHHNVCDNTNYAMPNKLFEMVFAGLPIVYSKKLHCISGFMESYPTSRGIDEVTPEEIAEAVRASSGMTKIPGDQPPGIIHERYSWDVQAKKLLNVYDTMLEKVCVE